MPKILIAEDETSIAENLIYALETEHFQCTHVTTAAEARKQLDTHGYDLFVLDVGLPDQSGFDLCRELRHDSQIPILFLTARNSEIDRILGLELGGDDYVTKPFSPREVVARIRAHLRRIKPSYQTSPIEQQTATTANKAQDSASYLLHDEHRMRILCQDTELNLTAHEYKLMLTFMAQPNRTFTREQLLIAAWDDPGAAMDRTVDAHVKSLRAKLRKAAPLLPECIHTRRGLGYYYSTDS